MRRKGRPNQLAQLAGTQCSVRYPRSESLLDFRGCLRRVVKPCSITMQNWTMRRRLASRGFALRLR